jgi:molecular chaperone Hsp33
MTQVDLPNSRLYSFLDAKNHLSISFLEGQKLYMDLVLIDEKKSSSFQSFRELVLSGTHFIQLLKHQEQLGFYIDSKDPKFLFKLECHAEGTLRSLLIPNQFESFNDRITGEIRLSKINPQTKVPYQSIIEAKNQTFAEIINDILEKSYQLKSKIIVPEKIDQSVMFSQIPMAHLKSEEQNHQKDFKEMLIQYQKPLNDFFAQNIQDQESIIQYFNSIGFTYLQSKEVKFYCPCSKQQMISSLYSLLQSNRDELFETGKNTLEVTCDYCHSTYQISEKDIQDSVVQ